MFEPVTLPSSIDGTCPSQTGAELNGRVSYCVTRGGKWVQLVREFVKSIQYGEIHISVHKGRVVEVRKMEKVRFDDS